MKHAHRDHPKLAEMSPSAEICWSLFMNKMSLRFWDRKMPMFVILLTQLLFFKLSKRSGLAFLICHFSLYEMTQTDTMY